jgi:hypothetical protein
MDKKVKSDNGRFAAWHWLQIAERPEINRLAQYENECRLCLADAIQMTQRADENLPLRNRGGCAAFVAKRIAAHDVQGAVGFQDIGDSVVVGQIDVSVGKDR